MSFKAQRNLASNAKSLIKCPTKTRMVDSGINSQYIAIILNVPVTPTHRTAIDGSYIRVLKVISHTILASSLQAGKIVFAKLNLFLAEDYQDPEEERRQQAKLRHLLALEE
jgi:hypothetical protein